jgi:hypothetical protein
VPLVQVVQEYEGGLALVRVVQESEVGPAQVQEGLVQVQLLRKSSSSRRLRPCSIQLVGPFLLTD